MLNELTGELNIIVLMEKATADDLIRAAEIFDKKSRYDTFTFGGEALVDLCMLEESQKEEIREAFGLDAVFSDGTGERGDVALYLSCEVELLDDGSLVATGYTFIAEDKSDQAEDECDNFAYGTPHPTPDQVKDLFLPRLAKAS